MNVAIYCRVSREDQTLEQQRYPLIRICEENGWDYTVYEEKISGASSSRPELNRMMEDIRNRDHKAVMVYKLDRLGRSLIHLLQLIEEFNNIGVQFICFKDNVDTKTPMGRFFVHIVGSFAELEREQIRERTKDKLSYLKQQGVVLGRPKGSKDKKKRTKSGYYLRWAKKSTPPKK